MDGQAISRLAIVRATYSAICHATFPLAPIAAKVKSPLDRSNGLFRFTRRSG